MDNILVRLVKENRDTSDKKIIGQQIITTLTCQLYKLLLSMETERNVAPQTFKCLLSMKNEMFEGFSQNDSHELLNFILDTIHEETKCRVELCLPSFPQAYHQIEQIKRKYMNDINSTNDLDEKLRYIKLYNSYESTHQQEIAIHSGVSYWAAYIEKNFSIISQYFMGVYHSNIKCGNCGSNSHAFEVFTSVSLEIPKDKEDITIYDCLDAFTTNEILSDKYNCVKCNMSTVCEKAITFWNVPEILIIHFKRFKTENVKINGEKAELIKLQKINSNVKYPMSIDISKYICEYNRKQIQYELSAVVHHYGQCGSGHYISFCKADKDEWFQFNDSHVSKVDDIEHQIMTDASYIIIYTKK
jgi:ubiquitin carboxyl-terminal hydrolase 8